MLTCDIEEHHSTDLMGHISRTLQIINYENAWALTSCPPSQYSCPKVLLTVFPVTSYGAKWYGKLDLLHLHIRKKERKSCFSSRRPLTYCSMHDYPLYVYKFSQWWSLFIGPFQNKVFYLIFTQRPACSMHDYHCMHDYLLRPTVCYIKRCII